jgi:hypothetical protein
MFFLESEAIAREHVELGDVVRRVDEHLSRQSTTAPLRPEDFAAVLSFDEFQVSSVFRLLEEKRVLGTETMGECPACQNLMPLSTMQQTWNEGVPIACSACHRNIPKRCQQVSLFRLTSDALDRIKVHIRDSQNSPGTIADEVPLNGREQQILMAMLKLEAVDSDRRKKARVIAKAEGYEDSNSIKSVLAKLVKLKLIDSKQYSGGGYWLTEAGKHRALKLKSIQDNP